MVVFDRDGNFLASWGEELIGPKNAHGIYIDSSDHLWATEWTGHCVRKFALDGTLLMTIGTAGQPAAQDGEPFNQPTDTCLSSSGELFISDGYVNARVHRYTADGRRILSWGEHGTGPGQLNLSHCVRLDRHDRVWVCDRENHRIQIFTQDGELLKIIPDLRQPDTIFFDPDDDVLYIAELGQRVSVMSLDGEILTQWGGRKSEAPGEFVACPHGIWRDSRGDLYVSEVQANGRLQKFVRV
jgi:sugar lactone lactonase YvrE